MMPSVARFVLPPHVESAVFSTLLSASVVLRLAVDVPARVPAPDAYKTSPCVYEASPVPPRATERVPVVSERATPNVDVAERV